MSRVSRFRRTATVFLSLVALVALSGVGSAAAVVPVPSLVRDIAVGGGGSDPLELSGVGSFALLTADDGVVGRELWRSDGTVGGTELVADIADGAAGSSPDWLTVVGGVAYLVADDGVHGSELWRSDGTVGGTELVADVRPGAEGSGISQLASVDGVLYFRADDGVHGMEPWSSDGSSAGTGMLADVRPGSEGSMAGVVPEFTGLGGEVFFAADDGVHGREPWRSDGTGAGTELLKDIRPGGQSSGQVMLYTQQVPYFMTVAGGKLFLAANDGVAGTE